MRTIVINTSKEAKNTRLDVLFKASFDQSGLLWYDSSLTELDEAACDIKQALITDTDTVDRDYNLIVLVDLYCFPRGNEISAVNIYRALLVRYINTVLINKLHREFSLLPKNVSVYFADSAEQKQDVDVSKMASNPIVQRQEAEAKQRFETAYDDDGNIVEGDVSDEKEEKKSRTLDQRLIMELFSWTEDIVKDSFEWKLKASVSEEVYIDLSETFKVISDSLKYSHESADVLEIALSDISDELFKEKDWESSSGKIEVPFVAGYSVRYLTHTFVRDNEQDIIEGFFNIFANIFSCVLKKELCDSIEVYSEEKIKSLLVNALKKYKHFSKEKNVTVKFEPIKAVFDKREKILDKRKETANADSSFKGKTAEDVAIKIIEKKEPMSQEATAKCAKMHGIDREFHILVEEIFGNYDTKTIKKQNDEIVKNCLEVLWKWRDKQTNEDFKQTVEALLKELDNSSNSSEENKSSRDTIAFIEEEFESEYTEIINDITEAQHKIASNKNILLETKDCILKYGDLMRKGKWYLMSTVGAVIAVIASVLPFIYVEYYASGGSGVFHAMYLLLTAGFVFLYCLASGIYISKINKKKLELKRKLEILKNDSEEERKASLAALYKYYSETVVKAETYNLLWREILRRDRENSKKGIKRNNHIKRLEFLTGAVERFMTMLKMEIDDDVDMAESKDEKRFEEEGLYLNGEESFHSETNQKVYSVLPAEKAEKKETEE